MTRCCSHIKVNVKDENRKTMQVAEPQFGHGSTQRQEHGPAAALSDLPGGWPPLPEEERIQTRPLL